MRHARLSGHKAPSAKEPCKETEHASEPNTAGRLELPDWELQQLGLGLLWRLSGKNMPAGDKGPVPDLGGPHMPRRSQDRASQAPQLLSLCSGNRTVTAEPTQPAARARDSRSPARGLRAAAGGQPSPPQQRKAHAARKTQQP